MARANKRCLGKRSATLDDFLVEDGILVCQLKTSINPYRQVPIALRQTILEQLHNNAGHLGIQKRCFWPGYEQDVKNAVQRCDRVKDKTILFPSIKP